MAKNRVLHHNLKSKLSTPKKGEKIVYGGGGFHIVKKDKIKKK